MSLPSRFLWQAYRAVLGRDGVPEVSPFDKPLLLWRLMRLLPDVMAEPAYAPLRRFLARDADLRKRFQLAERLADLFDQYQVYRADWLAAWAAGDDVLIKANGDRRPCPTSSAGRPACGGRCWPTWRRRAAAPGRPGPGGGA
jgi:exodeoxyribonuclease V gamma subunit